jgi:predicted GNAT superfamily acetyltransferase
VRPARILSRKSGDVQPLTDMSDLRAARPAPSDSRAQAASVALAAADQAGVKIRVLGSVPEFEAASGLIARIWSDPEWAEPKAPAQLLRALSHAGNFVAGAFHGADLVAVSVAFFGREGEATHLHSHITGTDARFQNRSLGFGLKQFQRWWALDNGVDTIRWTTDPLVRRNLYFNFVKLGATVVAYYPDFYGPMLDGINGDQESDRVLINWDLLSLRAVQAADGHVPEPSVEGAAHVLSPDGHGEPVLTPSDAATLLVWVPEDIVGMRQDNPGRARAWRQALRAAVADPVGKGYRAEAITRDGRCILAR